MDWISLLGRLVLAAVFLIAAVGKLADRQGWRRALSDFGIPKGAATPVALLVPTAELAITALLLISASARVGALGALALLGVFTVGIVVNLARGRNPDCHCFGQFRSTPVGASTVVRNVFLSAVAGFVLWRGGENPPLTALVSGLSAATWTALVLAAVAIVIVAIETWLLLGVVPQQGRLLMRVEALEAALDLRHVPGPPLGVKAPDFELRDIADSRVGLTGLRSAGRPVLLFFTNPHCTPCDELLPKLARWQREHASEVTIAVISRDAVELNRAKAVRHGLECVLVQKRREVVEAYQIESTPAGILVSADGTIASHIAYGPEHIEALLQQAINGWGDASLDTGQGRENGVAQHRAPSVGQSAPALLLPDLEGRSIALTSMRGSPTLVLFWNPDCGFCQQLLPELKAWEREHRASSPRVLLVSNGTVDSNRAMGLVSPIVLDADGSAMREFGASGTPMAVLVDAEGRIASSMVAGAQQVMTLASNVVSSRDAVSTSASIA